MKILLVIDQYDRGNNGTTMTAQRLAHTLMKHGHEVRVVSTGNSGNGKYLVREYWLPPIVNGIVTRQGMVFARPDEEVLREAIGWAELVHFLLPFRLSVKGLKIAKELKVPHTAAFHVQPENITYTLHLGKQKQVNTWLYRFFLNRFYKNFRHIHCPSRFIARELEANDYRARLHVISNGVAEDFVYRKHEKPEKYKDKYVILMIGRLSNEKRQDVLIDAIAKSRYESRIQLVLAGQGLKKANYRWRARKLTNRPVIRFFPHDQLINLLSVTDLYVHAADAEIEAISCIEAFSSGVVPVIANSPKSATPQFALDERSLFTAGDSGALAERIDDWLSKPEERRRMERCYSEYGKQFSLDGCVRQMEEMFEEEIRDYRRLTGAAQEDPADGRNVSSAGQNGPADGQSVSGAAYSGQSAAAGCPPCEEKHLIHMWTPFPFQAKQDYDFFPSGLGYRVAKKALLKLISVIVTLILKPVWGLRIEGRENREAVKGGAVTVCNHVHLMDCVMVEYALKHEHICFPTLESNFRIPVVRHLIRLLGAVPIPEDRAAFGKYLRETKRWVEEGNILHYYPEMVLHPYYQGIRGFKRGAFLTACETGAPVLPMVISYRRAGGISGALRRRPLLTLRFLPPVYPDSSLKGRAQSVALMEEVYAKMNEAYWN